MIFTFQLLGIIILTGLIIITYIKETKDILFKNILTTLYISQLLYTTSYIAINQNINKEIFIKAYLISLTISYSFLAIYYIIKGLKNKYSSKETICDNKTKLAKKLFIFLNLITTILIIIAKLDINYNQISGKAILVTELFILMYSIINIISLKSYNYTKHDKLNIIIITIISIMCNIISYSFIRIPAVNSSITLIALILFYSMNSNNDKEIEILQLEREHSIKNNFDKSKFLKELSHEIRTPLNTNDGFCQVIEDSDNIESIKEDTKDIRKASKDLIEIINGIIDMAIIESGNLEIINEAYNTKDLITLDQRASLQRCFFHAIFKEVKACGKQDQRHNSRDRRRYHGS